MSDLCHGGASGPLAEPRQENPQDRAVIEAQSAERAQHRPDGADADGRERTEVAVVVGGAEAALEMTHAGDVVRPAEPVPHHLQSPADEKAVSRKRRSAVLSRNE